MTRWLEHRNFGFVAPEGGGEDVFVHGSVLDGDSLVPGVALDASKRPLNHLERIGNPV